MGTTETLQLTDPSVHPDEPVLKAALGGAYRAYQALVELFDRNDMVYEWRYYRDGKAWLCKVQKKKRTIVWMSAWKGFIKAAIYIPERQMEEVYALPLSEETREHIRSTKNVGQSKPCTFEVRNQKALKDFEEIMQFKIRAK